MYLCIQNQFIMKRKGLLMMLAMLATAVMAQGQMQVQAGQTQV